MVNYITVKQKQQLRELKSKYFCTIDRCEYGSFDGIFIKDINKKSWAGIFNNNSTSVIKNIKYSLFVLDICFDVFKNTIKDV